MKSAPGFLKITKKKNPQNIAFVYIVRYNNLSEVGKIVLSPMNMSINSKGRIFFRWMYNLVHGSNPP